MPGAHWSKDFVEHLRTVHFTLILVAVGLTFLSFTRHDDRALNDVESILRLKDTWKLEWLVHLGPKGGQAYGNAGKPGQRILPRHAGIAVKVNGQTLTFRFPKNNRLISYEGGAVVDPGPGHLDEDFVSHFPVTIAEFARWWDDLLRRERYINVPEEISKDVTVDDSKNNHQVISGVQLITDGKQLSPSLGELKIVSEPNRLSRTANFMYIYDAQQSRSFKFQITTTSFPVAQEDIAKKLRVDRGTFWDTFPDLAKASAGAGAGALSLEDLDARLKQEAARGPEPFEIFGLKIPADQIVGAAGTTILLVVQLYFIVTLKELNRKLSPQDGCWDVPWLGMYQDRLSRFLYVLTTGILPAFVIVLLFRQTLRPLVGSGHIAGPAGLNIVGVWVALILSIGLGWLSWKYRPRVRSAWGKPIFPSCKSPDTLHKAARPRRGVPTH
jgi:hypothetical protein